MAAKGPSVARCLTVVESCLHAHRGRVLVQLQYIRAIAALLVVYYHAILQLQKVLPASPPAGMDIGDGGVDLFFVLSGFVMWVTTSAGPVSTFEFYWKRIRRIAPLYWSATVVAALVALVMPTLLRSTVFDPGHVLASFLFLPWLNPAPALESMIAPIVVPGWTLNYEMYFYLVFGIMLLLPQGMRLIGLTGAFAGVAISCRLLPFENTATLFYGNSVVFEFLAGAAIGHHYMTAGRLTLARGLLLLAAGSFLLLANNYLDPAIDRFFATGIPATMIVYAATAVDFSKLPHIGWLSRLGDASYSIYVTHSFVLAAMRVLFIAMPFGVLKNEIVFIVASLAMCIGAGLLVHALFESPVDRYLKRREPPKALGGEPVKSL